MFHGDGYVHRITRNVAPHHAVRRKPDPGDDHRRLSNGLLVRASRHQSAANLVIADNHESPRLLARAKRGQADGFKNAIELVLLDRARLVGPNRIPQFDKFKEIHSLTSANRWVPKGVVGDRPTG
jgi:hypothetical protein